MNINSSFETTGIITIDDIDFDFELKNQTLLLHFNPSDISILTDVVKNSKGGYSFNGTERLKYKVLKGRTKESKAIIMSISFSNLDMFHFYFSCSLHGCIILNENKSFNSVSIISPDISIVSVDFDEHPITYLESSLKIPFENNKKFLHVSLPNNDSIEFACYNSFITNSKNLSPLEYYGQIQLFISKTDSIEKLILYLGLVKSFLSFLCFRCDIIFTKILLGIYDENTHKNIVIGEYIAFDNPESLSDTKFKQSRFIPYKIIEPCVPRLLNLLFCNSLYLHHIKQYWPSTRFIDGGDVVNLIAGFEYEFKFTGIKIEKKSKNADQIKYIKRRYSYILKSDNINSYGKSLVKNAIKHLDDTMLEAKLSHIFQVIPEELIKKFKTYYSYINLDFNYKSTCTRISKLRNDFAHGNVQSTFSQETVYDFLILEIVLYFLQLQRIGLDENSIILALNSLFAMKSI